MLRNRFEQNTVEVQCNEQDKPYHFRHIMFDVQMGQRPTLNQLISCAPVWPAELIQKQDHLIFPASVLQELPQRFSTITLTTDLV